MNNSEYPSIYWEKFFKRFDEINSVPVKEWDNVNILSYFCDKYKNHYGLSFTFKFNSNSPSKSYEIFQMRKLSQMLSSDPQILKDYIDWWFENKIVLKKKRITTMAFMTDANVVNEYKFKRLVMDSGKTIDRTTGLPIKFIEIIDKYEGQCKTYGDLSFIRKSGEQKFKDMFVELEKNGFELNILERVS